MPDLDLIKQEEQVMRDRLRFALATGQPRA